MRCCWFLRISRIYTEVGCGLEHEARNWREEERLCEKIENEADDWM